MLIPEITIAVNATQLVFTLTGNILLCLAFSKVKSLRTAANCLLLSLSIADLLFAVVFLINIIVDSTEVQLACVLRRHLYHILNTVVLWSLAAISIDRLLAIKIPLRYAGIVTKRRAVIAVVILWIIGVTLAMLPSILKIARMEIADEDEDFTDLLFGKESCKKLRNRFPRTGKKGRGIKWRKLTKSFFLKVLPLILPYIILFVSYAWIFIISWRHYRRVKKQLEAVCPERKLQMKFAKTAAIIIGSFVVLFTPLLVLALVRMFYKKKIGFPALRVANLIASNSAWLNPPIYAWRNRNFRQAFRKILRPLFPNTSNGHSTSRGNNLQVPRTQRDELEIGMQGHYSLRTLEVGTRSTEGERQ